MFFFTKTTFSNKSGYCTSLIHPTLSSFPTSSLVAFYLFRAITLLFCLIGVKVWVNIESMGYNPGVNTWHVLMKPCKYILILLEKLAQPFMELGIQKRTNVDDSSRELVI